MLVTGLAFGTVAGEAAASSRLSITRARQAAYTLTRQVGTAEGASYALTGYCVRKSARRVRLTFRAGHRRRPSPRT